MRLLTVDQKETEENNMKKNILKPSFCEGMVFKLSSGELNTDND